MKKNIFKCYYLKSKYSSDVASSCTFIDEDGHSTLLDVKIHGYLMWSYSSDIYLKSSIDEHFSLIEQAENNPNEVYYGGGQHFELEISAEKVVFYHNEFDEEDGYPVLSCPLSTFKNGLIAWNAFLQLPKSIYSVVETVIEE